MNAERLLAQYEQIADAPDAIARLRRFILDLAVRGRLVPQDAGEERASELLKRIAKEKARLVKAGEIANSKNSKPVSFSELAFSIPQNWQPVNIEHALNELQTGPFGSSLHQSDYRVGGTPVINPASIQNEQIVPIDKMAVDARTLQRLASFKLRSGDIVLARRGEMGRCAIVTDREAGWLCGTGSLILRPSRLIYARFLALLIGSPFGREYLGGSAVGSTMQNLNQSILLNLPFGLPPLAEQYRIVAKVDELMALCDQLEAARGAREAVRDRLAAASFARLNAPDPETLQADACFALDALPALTTRPDQIKQLRQTILNLTVRGKLVPQDPNDEPIFATLQRAMARRAALVKAKKVRAKKLDGFDDLVASADLPSSWVLERLGNLVDPENTISYGVLVPGEEVPDGIPFVRAQDLALSGHPDRPNKTIAPEIEKAYARTRLRGGELLVCVVGSIGKLGIVPQSWAGANIARAVARILPIPEISREYLLIVMRGEPVQTYFTATTRTLAQPTLNVGLIEQTPIPLPPLAEQHRIVAKVDALMALCDRLEASLTATAATRRRLLDALLAEALAPAEDRELEAAE
jgi:type I restriction enzyme S subunit